VFVTQEGIKQVLSDLGKESEVEIKMAVLGTLKAMMSSDNSICVTFLKLNLLSNLLLSTL